MPAAASTELRGALARGGTGRVLGAFASAVYVQVGTAVLAVEASDAVGLPVTLVVAAPSAVQPFTSVRYGDPVLAGGARLRVGPLDLAVTRWWRPRTPRPATGLNGAALTELTRLLGEAPELPAPLPERLGTLRDTLARGGPGPSLAAAVRGLVGLGPGLTPAGDDALAGMLVALAGDPTLAASRAALSVAVEQVLAESPPERTTAVSAALLRQAAAGHGVPALVDVVDGLHGGRTARGDLRWDVVRLLAVGHTSGAALARGVVAAAQLHCHGWSGTADLTDERAEVAS